MQLIADTANAEKLDQLCSYLPIEGATTNPGIIAKEEKPLSQVIPPLVEILGRRPIFIQLMGKTADDMLSEAIAIQKKLGLGNNYITKIPVSKVGLAAIPKVKAAGISVAATAIATPLQALIAANAGSDHIIPYVNRLDNAGINGPEAVADMASILEQADSPALICAASFKSVDQIFRCALAGAHSVTVVPELLEEMAQHYLTDLAVEQFETKGRPYQDIT